MTKAAVRGLQEDLSSNHSRKGRILELDALRGIAALGVVVYHYGAHFGSRPFDAILYPFYNAGFLLVDFFFVLSGYVLARAYWKESRQDRIAHNVWARVARLYPLHLLTLLATIVLLKGIDPESSRAGYFLLDNNDNKHFLLNLLMLNQSGLQEGWSFNTPSWSISTEFIVNVAFLLFIGVGARGRVVVGVCSAVAVATAYYTAGPRLIQGDLVLGLVDTNLARCILGFGIGVSLYLGLDRLSLAHWLAARRFRTTTLGAGFIGALVIIMIASERQPPAWHYLVSIFIAAGCVCFVPYSPIFRSTLTVKPFVYLGDISYSVYLIHYPVQIALYSITTRYLDDSMLLSSITFLAYVAVVLGASALTHRYLELPAQRRFSSLIDGRRIAHSQKGRVQ